MSEKKHNFISLLSCPKCHSDLSHTSDNFTCVKCKSSYANDHGIPNFLPVLDANKQYQENIWTGKTYKVDPENHIFTTIQERFSNKLIKSLRPDGNVLDVGCFIGEKLWQVNRTINYVGVGIDISVPSLVDAKAIDIYGNNFIAADLEQLPFKDNSFDFVMIFDVIEHLSDQPKGFSEVARILKPGGRFLLHIPIKDNKYSFFWFKRKLFPEAALQEYLDVGHADARMLTSTQIKEYLTVNKMFVLKEVFYNGMLVHFFDREFTKIIAMLMSKILGKSKLPASHSSGSGTATGNSGLMRDLYGKYIVPILEVISLPDFVFSKLHIGNTYFVVSKKLK